MQPAIRPAQPDEAQQRFRRLLCCFAGLCLYFVNAGGGAAVAAPFELPDNANRFGFRLLSQLIGSEPQKRNFAVSPVSIELALGMTYAGADGTTATAIADAIGLNGLTRERLLGIESGLQNSLRDPGADVVLRIANALWVDESIPLKPGFGLDIKQIFNGEVFSRPFASADVVLAINRWVEEQTAGKIPALLTKPPSPPLLLVNAVYFRAPWANPFQSRANTTQPFYLEDRTPVSVTMMHREAWLPYLRSDSFEALRLPYAGNRFSLVLVLPAKGSRLSDLVQRLGERSWSELQNGFRPAECNLAVPRFSIAFDTALKEPLKRLGMKQPFDPQAADFRGMLAGTKPLHLESVFHKTLFRVDEAGSEAAAATAIGIVASAHQNRDLINITFDRPFLFTIADSSTRANLFVGILGDPENAKP